MSAPFAGELESEGFGDTHIAWFCDSKSPRPRGKSTQDPGVVKHVLLDGKRGELTSTVGVTAQPTAFDQPESAFDDAVLATHSGVDLEGFLEAIRLDEIEIVGRRVVLRIGTMGSTHQDANR